MATGPGRERWVLEIVRGREQGKRYLVGPGENAIGNALAGAPGLNLADQEDPSSPRRMAAKQACLTVSADALSIRDLDSPGGTFVNRQRLLSGQVRALQPGDTVQLGGVQLQVKREAQAELKQEPAAEPTPEPRPQPTTPAGSGPVSMSYTIAGAGTCRTWDDFLTLAAQRWNLVRDELTSGRLAEHLKRIGRTDLIPRPDAGMTADEQLDAWLARLPAKRSSAPELDVHPQALIVRAAAGGGLIRQTLRITNVGYRLLRSSARVETSGPARVRIAKAFPAARFQTIDLTEIPIEIELPDVTAAPSSTTPLGDVVIESNGGTRRIAVRLERPARTDLLPEASQGTGPMDLMSWGRPLGDWVASLSPSRRLVLAPLALATFRLLVVLAGLIPLVPGAAGAGAGGAPQLGAIAVVTAAAGFLAGAIWGTRRGAGGERAPLQGAFTGAVAGLFAAAVGFAVIQSLELPLGAWSASPPAAIAFWAVLGLGLAALSWLLLPPPGTTPTSPPRAEAAP